MAYILPVKGKSPEFPDSCFIAPNATLVGDLQMGAHCSVWFNAVIRADVNYIKIGDYTNIQDAVVIHCTYEKCGTDIGNYVNIGHQAMIHGCRIEDHVLVGMGAIIMDEAVIEPYCIIAAGAIVLEHMRCESGYLYAGVPAKKIKPISEQQRQLLDQLPHNYVLYSSWFQEDAI